jgi:hypothetical protein
MLVRVALGRQIKERQGRVNQAEPRRFLVSFDVENETVNYASYTVAHLDEWMADETDAFLVGRASPGRTHIWRHV